MATRRSIATIAQETYDHRMVGLKGILIIGTLFIIGGAATIISTAVLNKFVGLGLGIFIIICGLRMLRHAVRQIENERERLKRSKHTMTSTISGNMAHSETQQQFNRSSTSNANRVEHFFSNQNRAEFERPQDAVMSYVKHQFVTRSPKSGILLNSLHNASSLATNENMATTSFPQNNISNKTFDRCFSDTAQYEKSIQPDYSPDVLENNRSAMLATPPCIEQLPGSKIQSDYGPDHLENITYETPITQPATQQTSDIKNEWYYSSEPLENTRSVTLTTQHSIHQIPDNMSPRAKTHSTLSIQATPSQYPSDDDMSEPPLERAPPSYWEAQNL